MNLIEQLRNGTCPFTGKRYDCARCDEYKKLGMKGTGPWDMHMNMAFDGYLADGKRGMKSLYQLIGGKSSSFTRQECDDFFLDMYHLGAETVPVGECDNFCFRRGCMGHERLGEKELNNTKEN